MNIEIDRPFGVFVIDLLLFRFETEHVDGDGPKTRRQGRESVMAVGVGDGAEGLRALRCSYGCAGDGLAAGAHEAALGVEAAGTER